MKETKRLDNADEILEIPISYEEIGKEKGKEIGKELGREETQNKIALNMLKKGLDIDVIMETTMLSEDEVEQLKGQLDESPE